MGKSIWDTRFGKRGIAQDEYVQVEEGDSWKTIHGAKVLLGPDGRVKAGAGGKFDGSDYNKAKEWAQTRKSIIEAQKSWKSGQSILNAARTKAFHDAFPNVYTKSDDYREWMDHPDQISNNIIDYYGAALEKVYNQLQEEGGNKEAIKEVEDKLEAVKDEIKKRENEKGSPLYRMKARREAAEARKKAKEEEKKAKEEEKKDLAERKKLGLPITKAGRKLEAIVKKEESEGKIHRLDPPKLSSPMNENNAILHIAQKDDTGGSCASALIALIGNQEKGLDALDFQGGESRKVGARFSNYLVEEIEEINSDANLFQKYIKNPVCNTDEIVAALDKMTCNVNYYAGIAYHASMVRKTNDGSIEYLELQPWNGRGNGGWRTLTKSLKEYNGDASKRNEDAYKVLNKRFGVQNRSYVQGGDIIIRADKVAKTETFNLILPYINTNSSKQK